MNLLILSSCDSLELAAELGELNVALVIAMRDYVPDAMPQNLFEQGASHICKNTMHIDDICS